MADVDRVVGVVAHPSRELPRYWPLAENLRAWRLGLRAGQRPNARVIPAHDGDCWERDDRRNWRRRAWGHWSKDNRGPPRLDKTAPRTPAAADGTRPHDLRSRYITVQIYAGVPLTTIAKHAGTSVAMIDKQYAGVIANWDSQPVPAAVQIARARARGRSVDVGSEEGGRVLRLISLLLG